MTLNPSSELAGFDPLRIRRCRALKAVDQLLPA